MKLSSQVTVIVVTHTAWQPSVARQAFLQPPMPPTVANVASSPRFIAPFHGPWQFRPASCSHKTGAAGGGGDGRGGDGDRVGGGRGTGGSGGGGGGLGGGRGTGGGGGDGRGETAKRRRGGHGGDADDDCACLSTARPEPSSEFDGDVGESSEPATSMNIRPIASTAVSANTDLRRHWPWPGKSSSSSSLFDSSSDFTKSVDRLRVGLPCNVALQSTFRLAPFGFGVLLDD